MTSNISAPPIKPNSTLSKIHRGNISAPKKGVRECPRRTEGGIVSFDIKQPVMAGSHKREGIMRGIYDHLTTIQSPQSTEQGLLFPGAFHPPFSFSFFLFFVFEFICGLVKLGSEQCMKDSE